MIDEYSIVDLVGQLAKLQHSFLKYSFFKVQSFKYSDRVMTGWFYPKALLDRHPIEQRRAPIQTANRTDD